MNLAVGFHKDAISITDLDDNGIAEISFVYQVDCTSDVSLIEK